MASTYKLTFNIDKSDVEQATTLLEENLEAPAISTTEVTDHPDQWKVEAYFPVRPDEKQVENTLDKLPYTLLTVEELADEDWVSKVQSNLSPVWAKNLVIHGSHDREKFRGHPFAIEVDAGQAFGTAHHGTTRGCLLALQSILNRRLYRNVLDLGTGSGILSIAVSKLQRSALVIASDIDFISTRVAAENFQKNGVSALIKTIHASGLDHKSLKSRLPFDLIVANILAGPLIKLAPQISTAITSGGSLVLSGLLQSQTQSVFATYRNCGFVLERRFPLDEWMTLVLRKI